MKSHEYANLFPMMGVAETHSLADSIKDHGLRDKIILLDGKILDGRNRYKACEIAGVEPEFTDYEGDDALDFVVDHNLHRRHLSSSQRAMIASKLAVLKKGEFAGNQHTSHTPDGEHQLSHADRAAAAEQMNVGTSSVDRAKRVHRDGSQELIDAVNDGQITVTAAAEISKLPKDEQRETLDSGPKEVMRKSKEIKDKPKEEKPNAPRIPKWKPNDASRLWLMAKQELNKILSSDESRERVLNEVIEYAKTRIENNK